MRPARVVRRGVNVTYAPHCAGPASDAHDRIPMEAGWHCVECGTWEPEFVPGGVIRPGVPTMCMIDHRHTVECAPIPHGETEPITGGAGRVRETRVLAEASFTVPDTDEPRWGAWDWALYLVLAVGAGAAIGYMAWAFTYRL